MEKHFVNLQIRVLISREDGEFVAHGLEMDLLGYGKSPQEAINELSGLVASQVSFARQMKDDSLLFFKAPKEYFDRWEKAQEAALRNEALQDASGQMSVRASWVSLPTTEEGKSKFVQMADCA